MQDFPHHYTATAVGSPEGEVSVASKGLTAMTTAAPAEFGGPGDRWSPETLFVAAIADCFVLSFRAIARASKLTWIVLDCEVDGILERPDRKTRFTGFTIRASLHVPPDTDQRRARRILEKAEETCLITNSLSGERRLEATVEVAGSAAPGG
jgi:organic hydroperoxide reductase OsmC/OhrA